MAHDSERKPLRLAIALGGGLVFAGSLLYFTWQYAFGFDAPATGDNWGFPSHDQLAPVQRVCNASLAVCAVGLQGRADTGRSGAARAHDLRLDRERHVHCRLRLWQPVPGVVWRIDGAGGACCESSNWQPWSLPWPRLATSTFSICQAFAPR
jgi:hypothetical protein